MSISQFTLFTSLSLPNVLFIHCTVDVMFKNTSFNGYVNKMHYNYVFVFRISLFLYISCF